ncbi:MAG: hypothetical protein AAGI15_10570 [Pseudomonadota bacterium]
MTLLDLILITKILGTGAFVGLPLVLLPASALVARLAVSVAAVPYLRLYGVAILALLVGYSFGFSPFIDGEFPWGVVTMGIVSNGLGTITQLLTGGFRTAKGVTVLIAVIAAALLFCALNPSLAIRPL